MTIRLLTASEVRERASALADILLDCVRGGASVSFLETLTTPEAEAYFHKVADDIDSGGRVLLGAFNGEELVGTVQLVVSMPPNQPHRGEVSKLLVPRSARGRGIASRLMEQIEEVSRSLGKTLLVLDTATGEPAERLYIKLGWNRLGVIPRYARFPDGRWGDTTFFWKEVAGSPDEKSRP